MNIPERFLGGKPSFSGRVATLGRFRHMFEIGDVIPMSSSIDAVKAARERLRAERETPGYYGLTLADRHDRQADRDLIVQADLAAHPPDDDEPLTEEHCRAILGSKDVGRLYSGDQWIPEIRGIGQWVRLPIGATRRHFRLLLEAIAITGPQDVP